MEGKNSFIMYHEWKMYFDMLDITERGKLITAIFEYQTSGSVPGDLSPMLKMAFAFMKNQFDRDNEQYKKIRQNRIENGKKGGRPKKPNGFENNQMVFEETEKKQTKAKKAVNANVNANANVNVNVNDYQSPQDHPKGADVIFERFERFWAAYPRKVGKGAAANAFKKIKPSEELVQKMLDAITAQNQSDQWKKDGGQYIPNPATWLNQSRWEDETARPAEKDISLNEFFKEVQGWT